ncbi:hypothetical protein [Flavobacterium sp. LC2016-01]|uniref:hypothetical protein n=1 Tax=Flavobacterium sp. LC2016-01 TaxID=2675876 RepID=UPI0012BAE513|nr:hypothetical protein [Flavobacterium sp. LC2016-01]MTH15179.1 hypothetical protein [Flavobacterium sp. LC2016-01]
MIEVLIKKQKPQIMLEKFLKAKGTQKLSKEEQKNISGGNIPPGLCWDIWTEKEYKC